MKNITFNRLSCVFPKDTVWASGCAEIVGYSRSKNIHIVIDDGNCKSDDSSWLVHIWRPKNPDKHRFDWLPTVEMQHPLKYLNETKIIEAWYDFSYEGSCEMLKNLIENLS